MKEDNVDNQEGKKIFYNIKSLKEANVTQISWLIQNLILKNGIHMLVGEPASTKSLLSLLISLEAISKNVVLGKFKVNEKIKVMILDKENSLNNFIVRFKLLEKGHDIKIDLEDIKNNYLLFSDYSDLYLDVEKGNKEKILERIKKDNINLVIIDSLVRFFKADENSSSDSNKIKEILHEITKLDCAVFFLHHMNKSGTYRGSSDIRAFCDIVYVLERGEKQFTLSNNRFVGGKMRDAEDIEPISYELEVDKVDDIAVALKLKYVTAEVANKIDIKENSKSFYEGRKVDEKKILEIVSITKSYLKKNNIDEFKTKDLLDYLVKIFNDEKLVRDNFYGADGALRILLKENFLQKLEKKGWYKVIAK